MDNKQSPDDGMVEILNKLIPYYEEHLAVVKGMEGDILQYLEKYNLDFGICRCATQVFGTNLYYTEWVSAEAEGAYWFWQKSSKESQLEGLQFRIDKMKSLLNQAT